MSWLTLWGFIFQGAVLGATVAVAPGPLQAYVMAQSIRHGWRHTLPLIFAPVVTDVPIIAIVLIALVALPDWIVRGLQVVGGLMLIYLAYDTYKHANQLAATSPAPKEVRESFIKAALLNGLSPGPYVFWTTVAGPIFMKGWYESPWYGYAYLLGFGVALVVALAVYVFASSSTRHLDPKYQVWVTYFSAIFLVGFGIYQIITGIFFPGTTIAAH